MDKKQKGHLFYTYSEWWKSEVPAKSLLDGEDIRQGILVFARM